MSRPPWSGTPKDAGRSRLSVDDHRPVDAERVEDDFGDAVYAPESKGSSGVTCLFRGAEKDPHAGRAEEVRAGQIAADRSGGRADGPLQHAFQVGAGVLID